MLLTAEKQLETPAWSSLWHWYLNGAPALFYPCVLDLQISVGMYLSLHCLQLFLQAASCLLFLLLLLQQVILFHFQLADLGAKVQLLTRLLLPQLLHTGAKPEIMVR